MEDLTFDSGLRSFRRKSGLSVFLRRSGIANLPALLPDESKPDLLSRDFEMLRGSDQERAKILQLGQFLAEQTAFPGLQGWEGTAEKFEAAKWSGTVLMRYLDEQERSLAVEQRRLESRQRFLETQTKARESQQSLRSLSGRPTELTRDTGTPEAGREIEVWFYSIMQYSEIPARSPSIADGRQIGGSITIGDTTYLVARKFTAEQSGATDVDLFRAKVEGEADNTMGVCVSISGFSSVAIGCSSSRKTPPSSPGPWQPVPSTWRLSRASGELWIDYVGTCRRRATRNGRSGGSMANHGMRRTVQRTAVDAGQPSRFARSPSRGCSSIALSTMCPWRRCMWFPVDLSLRPEAS